MNKKIVFIIAWVVCTGSYAMRRADIDIDLGMGFLSSYGEIEKLERYDSYRVLLEVDPYIPLIDRNNFFFSMGAVFELSDRWFKYRNLPAHYDYRKYNDIGLLADVHPSISYNVHGFVPGLSGGVSFGLRYRKTRYKYSDKTEASEFYWNALMVGFNVKPQVTFWVEKFYLTGAFKFRYFFGADYYTFDSGDKEKYQNNRKIFGFSVTPGFKYRRFHFEIGFRVEKHFYKLEQDKNWPEWKVIEWENIPFIGISIGK